MKTYMKKTALAAVCGLAAAGAAGQVHAANWLMLQGTEPADSAPRIKVWGFIQAQYQHDNSDPNPAGGYIPPKLIGPNLTSQEQFNVNRARLGARGTGFPLDSEVNYFLLAEFGNNAITAPGTGSAYITDASITLNQIPGARVRVGLFKTPGPEEGLQAIHVFDYINFTEVSNQLMLERFPNAVQGTDHPGAPTLPVEESLNKFDRPVGAFRDVGVQVFDAFQVGDWEHSYAVMIGNGNGLNTGENDDNKDTYLYWASEKVFGGKGPFREGLKLFAWSHQGKRLLDNTGDGTHNPTEFDRERSGVGVKYYAKPWRVAAEYMQGEGMIFVGPDKPTFDQNGVLPAQPAADGAEGEASGWYVDLGWYVPGTRWELDLRYDVYNRLEGDPGPPGGPNIGRSFESEWKTATLGAQYHFNRKTRLTLNHALRDVETPAFDAGTGPNVQMDGIDSRTAVQLTHIF